MKQYSIGTVAKLTGLTSHNLRVWEKRHAAVTTTRTDSGRRIYDEEALQRVKLLKQCVNCGFTIGTIAQMTNDELTDLLEDYEENNTDIQPRRKKNLKGMTVWACGGEAIRIIDQLVKLPFQVDEIHRFTDTQHLANASLDEKPDMLIIEQASLSATETQDMAALIKKISAPHCLLFYRYSRQQDIAYLNSIGAQTLRSPVDKNSVYDLMDNLVKAPEGDPIMIPFKKVPERTFSDQELSKAAAITSSIDCECPQHLSELIKSLVGFENYSIHCENKDKESADLHRHIHLRTAQARAILEELLINVLKQEGINLNLAEH